MRWGRRRAVRRWLDSPRDSPRSHRPSEICDLKSSGAWRLSALCPGLPHTSYLIPPTFPLVVSIAFRLSAPRLRDGGARPIAHASRLHCLSALCPPASLNWNGSSCRTKEVSIAFRLSAPRLRVLYVEGTRELRVSIAFRLSALRLLLV